MPTPDIHSNSLPEKSDLDVHAQNRQNIISALTEDFMGVFIVDASRDTITTLRVSDAYAKSVQRIEGESSYSTRIRDGVSKNLLPQERARTLWEFSAEHVLEELKTHISYACTYKVRNRDGREQYHRAKFARLNTEDHSRCFILGIQNCDNDKQHEESIAEVERMHQNVFRILSTGYTGLYYFNLREKKGTVLSLSDKVQQDTGQNILGAANLAEAFQKYITNLVHPDDRPLFKALSTYDDARRALAGKKRHSIVFRRNFNGEYKYTEMTIVKSEPADEEAENVVVGFVEIDREYRERAHLEELEIAHANAISMENALLALQSDETLSNVNVLLETFLNGLKADKCYLTRIDNQAERLIADAESAVFKDKNVETSTHCASIPLIRNIFQDRNIEGLLELQEDDVIRLWDSYSLPANDFNRTCRSLVSIPVKVRNNLWGYINLAFRAPRRLTPQEESFIKRGSLLLGSALERKFVYDTLAQAKDEAQKNADFIEKVINMMPMSCFLKDADDDFKYLRCNESFCRHLGLTQKQILGHNDSELFPNAVNSVIHPYDRKALESDTPIVYEEGGGTDLDEGQTIIRWKQRIDGKDGHRLILCVAQDVTNERNRSKAEAFKAEVSSFIVNQPDHTKVFRHIAKKLLEFFKCEHVMLHCADGRRKDWFIDKDNTYCHICENCPMKGAQPEFFGKANMVQIDDTSSCQDLELPDDCPSKAILARQIIVDGEVWGKLAVLHTRKTHHFHRTGALVLQMATDALALALQRSNALAEISRKNIELTRALEEARSAERVKSTFLATMSHEIRTPLNAIIGFSKFLGDSNCTEAERKEYLEGITNSSNALLALINDILDLSKLEAKSVQMKGGHCDLTKLFGEMRQMFLFKTHEKHITLEERISEDFPLLNLQEERIRQILLNLIGNAVKFTQKGGVRFSADWDAEKSELTIAVQDTGIGISPEKLENIFDPFNQDGGVRGGKVYEGTGLGLPISRRLAEAAGGKLQVTSTLDKGSTFTLTIPDVGVCEGTVQKSAPKMPVDDHSLSLPSDVNVMLVDDVPLNLHILKLYFKNLGVPLDRISAHSNAQSAMDELHQSDTSKMKWIVLTDMWMPDMNGEAFAQKMRDDSALRNSIIIAVTADTDLEASFDSRLFDAVLTKPVTSKNLHAIITRFI